jgi:hypothetical protein
VVTPETINNGYGSGAAGDREGEGSTEVSGERDDAAGAMDVMQKNIRQCTRLVGRGAGEAEAESNRCDD